MIVSSITCAPPNAWLCISGAADAEVPEFAADRLVLASGSFIMVGCLPFVDGDTDVALGPASEIAPPGLMAFDGLLDTPDREVVVSTVEEEILLRAPGAGDLTRVRIWVDAPRTPSIVKIALE